MAASIGSTPLKPAVLGLLGRGALQEKIFFVHVPKCGGVSVSNAIARKYGLGARLGRSAFNVDPAASSVAARGCGVELQQFRRYITRYAGARANIKYVSGHVQYGVDLLPAGEWGLVTVLRDPVEKWFSQYFYNRYKVSSHSRVEEDLEAFISTPAAREYGDDYLRYLGSWKCRDAPSVDDAITNLRRFSVVGILEDLERFATDFQRRFGVTLRIQRRNKSPAPAKVRGAEIDDRLWRQVERLCEPNQAVYDEAVRLIASAGVLAARS